MLSSDQRTAEAADANIDVAHTDVLLKTGHLQKAIFNSANFSSIATDAKGVIQIFNVGAERMLGYTAADVVNKITPGRHFRSAGGHRARQGAERRTRHRRLRQASRRWSSRPRAGSKTSTS